MKNPEEEVKSGGRDESKDAADILEEIEVEDLTVDGICGVY